MHWSSITYARLPVCLPVYHLPLFACFSALCCPTLSKERGERIFSLFLSYLASSIINLPPRTQLPDRLFHSFRASKSGDRHILCSSRTSIYGLWSPKIKLWNGQSRMTQNRNRWACLRTPYVAAGKKQTTFPGNWYCFNREANVLAVHSIPSSWPFHFSPPSTIATSIT